MKRLFSVLLATVIMLACIPTLTSCGSDFVFAERDGGSYYAIVGVKDTSITEVVIPSTYKDKPVKEINGAFFGCENLVSVTLPEGIVQIANDAFENCKNLKSINIPSSVEIIGDSAFMGCESLESINIHNGITKIDPWAFNGCKSLKTVTIGTGVTEIGEHAFEECDNLSGITFLNTTNWVMEWKTIPSEELADPQNALDYLLKNPGTWRREVTE